LLALSTKGIAWRSVFVGTGVAVIQAAVSAGLGIACLETKNIPPDYHILGVRLGLPSLPRTQIVMRTRRRTADEEGMAAAVAAAVEAAAHAGRAAAAERAAITKLQQDNGLLDYKSARVLCVYRRGGGIGHGLYDHERELAEALEKRLAQQKAERVVNGGNVIEFDEMHRSWQMGGRRSDRENEAS